MARIITVGHGTLPADDFVALLKGADVTEVVDIRSYPGSRRNPQYGRDEMTRWLPDAGIAYTWIKDLGGRRKPVPDSKHIALRHTSFQAYADHMETEEFHRGVDALLEREGLPAVMCSESVWWHCHRRLLADHLVIVRGVDVVHLVHDGRLSPHAPTPEARRAGDHVLYDLVE